jgi:hypothetical protein
MNVLLTRMDGRKIDVNMDQILYRVEHGQNTILRPLCMGHYMPEDIHVAESLTEIRQKIFAAIGGLG